MSTDGIKFHHGDCQVFRATKERIWDPSVIQIDETTYRMYFFAPEDRGLHTVGNNQIYSAISTEGLHWYQEDGIRFEHEGILDPDVIKISNKWYMYTWYSDINNENIPKLVITQSDDSFIFSKISEQQI